MKMFNRKAFTLIEILIVISIIAILAAVVAPNFVGFDRDARVAATKSNLEAIRAAITLFRAKESTYPATLGALTTETYIDAGATKTYLTAIPPEMISSAAGSSAVAVMDDDDTVPANDDTPGWGYSADRARVWVYNGAALDDTWGDAQGQTPSNW